MLAAWASAALWVVSLILPSVQLCLRCQGEWVHRCTPYHVAAGGRARRHHCCKSEQQLSSALQ